MRNIAILIVLLLASVSVADVISGSSHYSDAVEFDNFIEDCGVYNARTKIIYKNGGYQYVAYFSENYSLDDDLEEVFSCAISAGYTSRSTSWSSAACVCVYNDEVVAITTEDCRVMVTAWEYGYSLGELYNYYLTYSMALDRDETNW